VKTMSSRLQMTAEKREGTGKGTARALRRENKIPAVIYGSNKSPLSIVLDAKTINMEYNRGRMFTTLVDMDVEGEKTLVLARDVQLHPVTDVVLHADFLRVSPKTRITVNVPVQFVGEEESPALNKKGILSIVRHEVELSCVATDIPDFIEVSVADIDFGDTVKISHAKLPTGVTPVITDRDFTIATIIEPRGGSDDAEAEAAETAEAEGENAATAE